MLNCNMLHHVAFAEHNTSLHCPSLQARCYFAPPQIRRLALLCHLRLFSRTVSIQGSCPPCYATMQARSHCCAKCLQVQGGPAARPPLAAAAGSRHAIQLTIAAADLWAYHDIHIAHTSVTQALVTSWLRSALREDAQRADLCQACALCDTCKLTCFTPDVTPLRDAEVDVRLEDRMGMQVTATTSWKTSSLCRACDSLPVI